MRLVASVLLVSIVAVGATASARADETRSTPDFTAVAEFVEQGYKASELPGAAVQVYQDGHLIYEKFFGDYTAETVVPIASASKWLAGATIMSLVDDGTLDLDAPISTYLPQFTGDKGKVTIRQMFSHTSGWTDPVSAWNYGMTMAEYADHIAKNGVEAVPAGTELRYGSVGMQVAGCAAVAVTGKTWNELFTERVAEPCDMRDTTFTRTELNKNPMLAGGARSTLRDYGHFLEMILAGGVYDGRRVLSEKAIREMQTDQTRELPLTVASNDRRGRKSHYGIGEWIDVQDDSGKTLQVSSPGAFGFRPWINLPRNLYGVLMVQHPLGAAAGGRVAYDPWELIDLVHETVDAAK